MIFFICKKNTDTPTLPELQTKREMTRLEENLRVHIKAPLKKKLKNGGLIAICVIQENYRTTYVEVFIEILRFIFGILPFFKKKKKKKKKKTQMLPM